MTLYAIYPPTRHLAVKVRLFIDLLVERFSTGSAKSNSRFRRQDAPDAAEKGRYLSVDDRAHVSLPEASRR